LRDWVRQTDSVEGAGVLRQLRIRIAFFLAAIVAVLLLLGAAWQAIDTFHRLRSVELERDQWQRPAQVLEALGLTQSTTVVDLGSGAGYFALKLSDAVGDRGRVYAVDVRRRPLLFLWVRALLGNRRNITVTHRRAEDPSVFPGRVDAVLIANSYHEFSQPEAVLAHAFRFLVAGGRLVVLDRSSAPANIPDDPGESRHHHVAAAAVERDLLQSGFEIASRVDDFIDRGKESWWLIVGRKPSNPAASGQGGRAGVSYRVARAMPPLGA
jgi:predicted methyltransferase